MMRREMVERRRWISEQEFLDLLGICSLLPGPTATELAILLGYERAGWPALFLENLAWECDPDFCRREIDAILKIAIQRRLEFLFILRLQGLARFLFGMLCRLKKS